MSGNRSDSAASAILQRISGARSCHRAQHHRLCDRDKDRGDLLLYRLDCRGRGGHSVTNWDKANFAELRSIGLWGESEQFRQFW
jgi:hypothetical protein